MTKEGMIRRFGFLSLTALLALAGPAARADEKQIIQELREVRAIVEQQARQIDALATQVTRLNQYLGARYGAVPPADAPIEAPRAEPVEKAEPAAEGPRHIVVKGDNLTSIAKQYNVTLGELQKANKNVNPAKLQIGQSVAIPTAKTPEQPAEKKETP
jgi:LysM repeat protein